MKLTNSNVFPYLKNPKVGATHICKARALPSTKVQAGERKLHYYPSAYGRGQAYIDGEVHIPWS